MIQLGKQYNNTLLRTIICTQRHQLSQHIYFPNIKQWSSRALCLTWQPVLFLLFQTEPSLRFMRFVFVIIFERSAK